MILKLLTWYDSSFNGYVSYCPALDKYSQAETREEALKAIRFGIVTYSKVLEERNTYKHANKPMLETTEICFEEKL